MINSVGAMISFTVTIVFFLTKFHEVWPVFVFLPIIVYLFHRIKKHYDSVGPPAKINNLRKGSYRLKEMSL